GVLRRDVLRHRLEHALVVDDATAEPRVVQLLAEDRLREAAGRLGRARGIAADALVERLDERLSVGALLHADDLVALPLPPIDHAALELDAELLRKLARILELGAAERDAVGVV